MSLVPATATPHDEADRDKTHATEMLEWRRFARHLADLSAAVIKPHFRSDLRVELKADLSPVTIADMHAEETMRAAIGRAYPDHGVLGEEFGHHQPDARYQWVLDPIDGTKAFITGSYLFGTLIALLKDGQPILGVINHPIFADFLIGDGHTTQLNDRPVHVRACTRIEDAVMLNTAHWNVANYHNGEAFATLSRRVARYHNWGDCHGYYLVAIGGADIMTDPILNPWDLMALLPIIEGAGGRATDWQGRPALGGNGLVVTAGDIHDQVIRALNPDLA
jgi:myo-inositol-1(or 4)-monophosphatase